jgi:predicted lipoprotein with Yx(FWY)xxD motif
MRTVLLALLAVPALAFAACGDDEDSATPATTEPAAAGAETEADKPQPKPEPPDKLGIEITTADSEFGTVLFGSDDRAIYLFDKETTDRSECYGACAEAWPPVVTDGQPVAGGEVDSKLLGTTERDDGETQVTYDGRPLYYYVDDPPGEILCHNVEEFGGLWLVVDPGGEAVQ